MTAPLPLAVSTGGWGAMKVRPQLITWTSCPVECPAGVLCEERPGEQSEASKVLVGEWTAHLLPCQLWALPCF